MAILVASSSNLMPHWHYPTLVECSSGGVYKKVNYWPAYTPPQFRGGGTAGKGSLINPAMGSKAESLIALHRDNMSGTATIDWLIILGTWGADKVKERYWREEPCLRSADVQLQRLPLSLLLENDPLDEAIRRLPTHHVSKDISSPVDSGAHTLCNPNGDEIGKRLPGAFPMQKS